ncbi:hypothetical protein ACP4OV_016765 [Aristida adscensionis]
MASILATKQLDGPASYLRWKESLLLRLHLAGVAHVLSDDDRRHRRPAAGDDDTAAEKGERDDAICRGHILDTISDRLLPDYARFATAAELWSALSRTYDVETPYDWNNMFHEFEFDESRPFLEQLAHAEALGAAARLSDCGMAYALESKLPAPVAYGVILRSFRSDRKGMSLVWHVARKLVSTDEVWPEPKVNKARWNRDDPGHSARGGKRRRRA